MGSLVKLFENRSVGQIPSSATSVPPTEFLVFKWGKNTTLKGDFYLEREAAESMLAEVERREIDLFVDYNHSSLDAENPVQGEAAGWYDLELRSDGLWAVNVRWVDDAAQRLMAKKYRYFSPTFLTDEDGVIVEWINMALTNLPATDKQRPLIAASLLKEIKMKTAKRLAAPKTPHASLADHLAAHAKVNGASLDEMADNLSMEPERMKACAEGKLFPNKEEATSMTEKLGIKEEHMSAYKKKFGDDNDSEEDDTPTGDGDDGDSDDDGGDEHETTRGDEDADEEDAPVKKTSRETKSELMELTGASTPREARKAFLALQSQAAAAEGLVKRFEKLERDNAKREITALVSQGIREGKLAPAQREWALKRDAEELRELLDCTPSRYSNRAEMPVDFDGETDDSFGGARGGASISSEIDNVVALMNRDSGHPALEGKVKITTDAVKARAKKGRPQSA